MSDSATFLGPTRTGKPPLPVDADAGQIATVLRRALHTVECRELGSEAAQQQFGPFADTADSRVTVLIDEDELRVRHPGHSELHQLARAVRERGPAVNVVLVPPKPIMAVMDEMAHVVRQVAESASGEAPAGRPRQGHELDRLLRTVRWCPKGAREATDER
ncbi:hypothetical protein PZB75_30845 (plasmid) [Streptomyces sp. AM 4-1-1]|uniref:hypothetical protein n=1 Tax=Streptomyces sp. AM 4-1-1 TaxID=3028710 RepID=UPI0023BA05D8|nr:hypothetical protein [Streptomyces sp. AM 4-1-1]WEH37803.1 hypothetical protein PZB75_30845 [Streptomyces sp. AM 4-1-1]